MASSLADPVTAALVDRQMRNWELARSQRPSRSLRRERQVEDFICVSRMVGVRDAVADLLSETLGWPVFDKRILDAMAGDDRRLRLVYEAMDEHDPGWWEGVLSPMIRDGLYTNDYFHRLCKTVLSLARESSGVFVGRGLDRVLPAVQGLRVRLIAPLEERVAWYAEDRAVPSETARREIGRIEADRTAFLRRNYQIEAGDPLRHDLIVRLDRWQPAQVVDLILRGRQLKLAG